MPARVSDVGSRWMGVRDGDDKKQPLRRDGITTIRHPPISSSPLFLRV